ncbi:MAG: peptidoglycan-binding domain-containing protein, partial [Thalassolituus sp.]
MPGPFDDIKNYARSRGYNLAGMDSPLASLLSLIGRVGTATTPSAGGAPGGSATQPGGGQSNASGATDNGAAGNNANGDGGDNTVGNGTEGNGTDNGDGNGAAATNTGTTTEVTITELKKGDNDATHTWNGQSYPNENGTYVKNLQERLLELGYWVSSPSSSNGRLCDGDYGVTTKGTVALFQLEHMALNPDNSIDESKITGVYDTATITAMEAATTTRPSHKAANLAGDVQFVQLPPSTNYTRYSPQYDDGGEA